MRKSASPTVRALDELKALHENVIEHLDSENYTRLSSDIDNIKRGSDKSAVEMVVRCIENLDIPYKLEHKTLCNIRRYDGNLEFKIVFDAYKEPKADVINKEIGKIIQRRRNAKADLEAWYIKSLYDIAGGSNFTEFRVKR